MENKTVKSIKRIKELGKMYYEQTPWEFLVTMDQAAAEAILDSEAKKTKSIIVAQRNILGADPDLVALVNEHYEEIELHEDSMEVVIKPVRDEINELRCQLMALNAKIEEGNEVALVEEELMDKQLPAVLLEDPTPQFLGGDN